ncbi:Hsp20/alpha crystallin family protein [Spirosoma endbachense]|uniref:Hsp20 family protein n=1 Tax=Spirosoma endbachense TaxID=2666025 RepID=A0A6P1W0F7_9BACT|nr:Hsp20/alpha crystallin family protein [Spirosoma endbachense]QHV97490.1 Hsp20 family protein [Spirosoma endbachense]
MHHNQAFQSDYKGGCGSMGRGKFSGFKGRGRFGNFWGRHAGGFFQPPVNIEETDDNYIISLFAAGIIKENVTLTVKDDILTIAYPGSNQDTNSESTTQDKYTYQEHSVGSFERSFRLNDKVIVETISASYAEGILKVVLPKNPATNKPAQTITVG